MAKQVSFTIDTVIDGKVRHQQEGLSIADLQEYRMINALEHITLCEMFDVKEFDLTVRLIEE